LIARRIVCWTRTGETLAAGERYGLIRFGSQVDITFPMSAQVRIKAGDRVEAGQSVLAEIT
jgi:phosphatidylserine decarboxylase